MEKGAGNLRGRITPVIVFIAFYVTALVSLYRCGFPLLLTIGGSAAGLVLPSLLLPQKKIRFWTIIVLTAVVAGCGRVALYRQMNIVPAERLIGRTCVVTAELSEQPEKNDYGYVLQMKLISAEDAAGQCTAGIKFLCYAGEQIPEMQIGDTLKFTAEISTPKESGKYSDSSGYLFRVFLKDTSPEVMKTNNFSLYRMTAQVRQYCVDAINSLVGGEEGALADGVLLGDKAQFTDNMYDAFRRTGMSHAVAVSGMHISIFIAALMFFFDLVGLHRRLAAVLVCVAAIFFTAVTGFSPSALRACIMALILYGGKLLRRERDSLTSLFIALFLILTAAPHLSFSLSLWLSFTATLGILVLGDPLARWLFRPFERWNRGQKLLRFFTESLAVSFSAILFMLPLSGVFFGEVSVLGPLAMLLCQIPITLLFGLGLLFSAVAWIPGVNQIVAYLVHGCAFIILKILYALSNFPYALVPLDYGFLAIAGVAALLMLGLYYFKRRRGDVKITPLLLSLLLLVPLCGISSVRFQVRTGYGERALFTSIDIGQGDCTAIISGDRAVLFDGGSLNRITADDTVEKYLSKNGVQRVEAIFLSHFHEDHTSAIASILNRFEVGTLYFPDMESKERPAIEQAAEKNEVLVVPVSQNRILSPMKNLTVELICDHFEVEQTDNANENSMIAFANFKGSTLLVTGDLTERGERGLLALDKLLDCDVLKVAHHGSKTSTTSSFLRETTPLAALVSVGKNSFGHPGDETLKRLKKYTQFVFRTDELGTIELYTEGNSEFIRLKG